MQGLKTKTESVKCPLSLYPRSYSSSSVVENCDIFESLQISPSIEVAAVRTKLVLALP